MKNLRPITTFLFFMFGIFFAWGQVSYIQTDTLYIELPVINQGSVKNARECYVDYGHKKVRYSPNELKGYGLGNGADYVSKTIQLGDSYKKVFLEALESGDYSLYYYPGKDGKRFFVAYGDTLIPELLKKTYRKQLKEWSYIDCSELKDDINLVKYNKRSLKKFINKYNTKDLSPFPFPKVGLMIGNEMQKLNPIYDVLIASGLFRYNYESSFLVGAFIDYPILLSDFSAHLELYYSNHSYSYSKITESEDLLLNVTTSDLKAPLLFRYTLPFRKFRPFVNIGGIYAYNFNPSGFFNYFTTDGFKVRRSEISSKHHFGYSVGGGLEYKLNYKNSLFLDFRYSELYGSSPGNEINYSLMQLSLGFNFR